jgi:hypothetical protein
MVKRLSTNGPGRNNDPKIMMMRKADSLATGRWTSGGTPKQKSKPRKVTLPTLETSRKWREK